jgi:hypothetical protein
VLIVPSRHGVLIRQTEEPWRHIVHGHQEMDGLRDWALATLAEPDMTQQGDDGALLAVRSWPESPLAGRFIVVAYRETSPEDGFIMTAYVTRWPSARRVTLWRR